MISVKTYENDLLFALRSGKKARCRGYCLICGKRLNKNSGPVAHKKCWTASNLNTIINNFLRSNDDDSEG